MLWYHLNEPGMLRRGAAGLVKIIFVVTFVFVVF
jgi:hypothetical protein